MSSLTLWTRRDPFADFDAVVRGAFGPAPKQGFVPAAEILRDGQDAVVRLELPGVDIVKDVNVELANGRLAVHGERRDERTEDNHAGYRLREVRYGSFRRTFSLPRHITADALSADYNDGVLTVRVSGAFQDAEPKRIAVTGVTADDEK